MYNYLTLNALGGGNFEPSKLVSSIVVYIEGRILAFLGAGIRPFRVFRFLHFLRSKCRKMKEKSLKMAFQCIFLAREQEIFSFQIDTISPYYNINR